MGEQKMSETFLKPKETVIEKTREAKPGFFGYRNGGFAVKPLPRKEKKLSFPKAAFVKSLMRETTGLKPYELRIIDLLKSSGVKVDKKARKYAKKKLGDFTKAKKKVVELQALINEKKSF